MPQAARGRILKFSPEFTMGNVLTIIPMVISLGAFYGSQQQTNTQTQKQIEANAQDSKEDIKTLTMTMNRQFDSLRSDIKDQNKTLASVQTDVGVLRGRASADVFSASKK